MYLVRLNSVFRNFVLQTAKNRQTPDDSVDQQRPGKL